MFDRLIRQAGRKASAQRGGILIKVTRARRAPPGELACGVER